MSGSTSDSLDSKQSKPAEEKWLFTEDQLQNTPSRRDKVLPAKELNYRQQAANLIQDMGQRLPVNQLTINTAIVYMHRFYMFHSFQAFSRFVMAPTALFLAAKVEEQPRKLEHVIRICHSCLHPDKPHLDVHSDNYLKQAQQLVEHELILLQTLGFDISIDHPHTHVVKCTQLVKASRDLSQMAYFMATNSLHLTTFCLEYKPTVVSAMCIHLSCKWSNYEIPLSSEGKAYWTYMDCTITEPLLENIINEFLKILNLCPTRLRKLKNYKPSSRDGPGGSTPQSKDGQQPKPPASKVPPGRTANSQAATDSKRIGLNPPPSEVQKKPTASLTIAEYKHKREKELLHTNKQASSSAQANEKPPLNVTNEKSLQQQQPTAAKNAHKPPILRPGHSDVKAGPQSTMQRKAMVDHKRSAKPPHPGQKPHSGLPSGIPGLQKPKHPTHQAHGVTQQHKEHPRMQPHQQQRPHVLHQTKPAVAKPKEITLAKSREPQLAEKKNVQGSPQVLKSSVDRGDNLLAGMEQQVTDQIKAEKSVESTAKPVESSTFVRPPPVHLLHTSSLKEHKNRRSVPALSSQREFAASHGQASSATKASYKFLYDQYKKNPEALKQQLKLKAQTEPLTEEEKKIWQKLKKKEVDRQKRKRKNEKHKLNRSQPIESHGATEGGDATPGGGPLTVRIKLPPSVRAEISKNQSASVSGSGPPLPCSSGSDAIVTSPGEGISQSGRKRTHTHDSSGHSDHLSAKLPKKSESHHHQSHDSSKHRHRHSRSGSHAHHNHHSKSHHSGHKIDEATFQQALSDAVSLVQSGQAAPNTSASEKAVPTVTLKRSGVQNGSADSYVAHSSRHHRHKASGRSNQLCFDPSAPISATPPEDLFDAEEQQKAESPNTLATESADVSSPEMGEIIDDDEESSPFRDHLSDRSSRQKKAFLQKQHLNNNNLQEYWGSTSTSSGYTHPPSVTRQNAKFEGQKNYDSRLPPMLSLTIKPNRTEQR